MRLNPPTRPFVEFILSEVEGLMVTRSYLLPWREKVRMWVALDSPSAEGPAGSP